MRKTVLFGLIAVILVLGGATGMLYGKYRKSQSDYSAMQASEETTRNRYANTIDAIAEIQDSLNAIALGDANIKIQKDAEGRISTPNSQEALDRISLLRAGIERSKKRINQLQSSLRDSGPPEPPMPTVWPPPLTLAEIRAQAHTLLPGARIRRHLYWRYSLVYLNA